MDETAEFDGPIYRGPLGRRPPTDQRHATRYGITEETLPDKPTPVILGTNWYAGFDNPETDEDGNRWFPADQSKWGGMRGGHCYILKPPSLRDNIEWWDYYNQAGWNACVGFGIARALTLLNRERYDALEIYFRALEIDEWPGVEDWGTSVRAGLDIVRERGPRQVFRGKVRTADPGDGITANRWGNSIRDIARSLDPASNGQLILDRRYVDVLNSWGRPFPHITRMALSSLDVLTLRMGGDVAIITDR